MRVLFRLEANASVGLGHAARCLGLAEALLAGGHCCALLTRNSEAGFLRGWLALADRYPHFTHIAETRSCQDLTEFNAILDAAEAVHADWLVLDGYDFPDDLRPALAAARPDLPRLDLDDGMDRHIGATIRLNQNCQTDRNGRFLQADGTILLCGLSYFLARPALLRLARRDVPERPDVVVSLGGSDVENIGLAVVRAVLRQPDLPDDLHVAFACTADDAGFAVALREFAGEPRVTVHHKADLLDLLGSATHAICAGGVTALEMVMLGIAPVILVLAENQQQGTVCLCNAGAAYCAGNVEDAGSTLVELLRSPGAYAPGAARCKTMIDGRGAGRVVAEMAAFGADKEGRS